jgi:N6-adenosine-specific RNA methylase IME4
MANQPPEAERPNRSSEWPGSERARWTIERRAPGVLRAHPEAGRVPPVEAATFRALRSDIIARGVQVPLEVTAEGVVLDGHLRLRAAMELGLEKVPVQTVSAEDEVEYLLRAAILRRQLTASQRSALAVELTQYTDARIAARQRQLANLQPAGAEVAILPPRGKTRDLAASLAGVSPRTVQDAETVKAADPELFEQVKCGKLPVDRAARQVRQRRRDDALPPPPALPTGPFELIYADPPWRLPGSPDSSRAVENHYPTMQLEEIKAMQIPAADDALLLLWGVNSMTPQALEVIDAWGFTYVNQYVWVKDKFGLGQYNRCQHELLHVARRGNFPPPPAERRVSSVIHAPRGRHSEKPAAVYELIERMYPRASKLELFARGSARPGWTNWGNQAGEEPAR